MINVMTLPLGTALSIALVRPPKYHIDCAPIQWIQPLLLRVTRSVLLKIRTLLLVVLIPLCSHTRRLHNRNRPMGSDRGDGVYHAHLENHGASPFYILYHRNASPKTLALDYTAMSSA